MKNLFTSDELQTGMFLVLNSAGKPFKDLGYARSAAFKVAYNSSCPRSYGLCSVFTDGCYTQFAENKNDFLKLLNADETGYRPLTKEELFQLFESSNQGFY